MSTSAVYARVYIYILCICIHLQVKFSVEFLVGAGIVVIVFVLVTLIDYFGNGSDPIWTLMKKTWHWLHDDSQSRYYGISEVQ